MNKKTIVSIGMFDFLKGFVMITIVIGHTISMYSFENNTFITPFLDLLYALFMLCGKPVLFIVSGYGFRKSSVKKCFTLQSKYMLKPYAYAAVGTLALHLITRYFVIGSAKSAIKATWQLAVGFLLGTPDNHVFFGETYYNCGPMWYILALYVGWIIYNALVNWLPDKIVFPAAIVCSLIGCWLEHLGFDYFCIPQGLCVVMYLHMGYLLKKKKILHRDIDWKQNLLSIFIVLVIFAYAVLTDQAKDSGTFIGGLDPVLTLLMGFGGCVFLIYLLQINRLKISNSGLMSKIGNYSLFIFCIHTVEMHGIPWYMYVERFGANSVGAFLLQCVLRAIFITVVTFAVVNRKKFFGICRRRKQNAANS